ncbi:MAG: hypothetical protein JO180_01480, partial [Gemmatirosa sp.]|nr:hypothetical protein [Gemmatirosa sp.]
AANPALSQPAEAIILRCLAKAPEDRFQNAAEVAAMLAAVAHPGALGSHPALAGGPTVDLEAPTRVAAPLPTARPVHRRRLAPMAAAAALLVAGGGAAGAWWISGRQPPVQQPVATPASPPIPSPVASPAESIAAAPPPTTPVESTPVAPVVRATGSLAIQVPAGATIVVNDRAVGAGGWHNDSLPAGRYRIRATVAALPNCATATMSSNVDLVRGDHRVVRLQPTGCGALALNVAPIHAHFTLSAGTDVVSDGALPLAQPLIVPEGDYRLVVEAPYCARYDDRVRIQSGGMRNERIRLICTQ